MVYIHTVWDVKKKIYKVNDNTWLNEFFSQNLKSWENTVNLCLSLGKLQSTNSSKSALYCDYKQQITNGTQKKRFYKIS